ncbi:MAG: TAXI family TRAP transporter solute-binding subunit [Candidatus Methylacidiphilales bacterium]
MQVKRFWAWCRLYWPVMAVVVGVAGSIWLAFELVEPAPPRRLVLAAGPPGGGYDYWARRYQEAFAREGITLEIRETNGSIDNLRLVHDPQSGVDVAFAQSGVGWMAGVFAESPDESPILSIGKLYFEPLWIFTRSGEGFGALRELKGKRLAVGIEGSGTKALAVDLLKWSGVTPENATFIELARDREIEALLSGEVDAAFRVEGDGSPTLRRWVADSRVELHSFPDTDAYVRRFGFLTRAILPESVYDFARNVPDQQIELIAPATVLVTTEALHPALVYLFLETARKLHGGHSILADAGQFPNATNLEFPLHPEAERYFQHGPPFLQRYLPFHWAVLIDRTKFLLLPLLTLLIPLIRIAYPTYRWSVRRNIWKWYKMVHEIEDHHQKGCASRNDLKARLDSLERKLAEVQVPLAYAAELYTLRHHLIMTRKRIERDELKEARESLATDGQGSG